MPKSPPRYTREIVTELGAKITIKIEPDNNKVVAFVDDELSYAATLDPKAAHQLGHTLIQAARLAAMNVLDPTPQKIQVHDNTDQVGVHLRADQ